ncbi:MAG: glycosyltransferase family 39 protein, partial [Anaerolineales bacterium]|nr:glycosyltransferase family 39 protein [Anaerolineales bacterium]
LNNPHWTSYKPGLVHKDNKAQYLPQKAYQFPYTGTALVMYLLRLYSAVLAALTVWVTWLLGRELWPERPWAALLTAAVVGLNPMFIYIAGAFNNDNLVTLCGTLMLWLSMRALKNGFRWSETVLIGVVWAGALLSKLPGLFLVVPWGLALLFVSWQRRSWALLLTRGAAITAVFGGLAGWWFVRNQQIYGEPLALERVLAVWGARAGRQFRLEWLLADVTNSWTNFWGRFGFGQIVLHNWFYLLLTVLSLAAGVGLLWRLIQWGRAQRFSLRPEVGPWLVLTVTWGIFVAALFYYILRNPTGANGRYTFPALAAFGALFTCGWLALLPSEKSKRPLLAILILVLLGLNVYTAAFLYWTYAPPTAEFATETPQPWRWETIRLLGTTLHGRSFQDGEVLALDACWQTTAPLENNYTLFINVSDEQFNKFGERNTQPGLGNWPTSFWVPGETFCETYHVPITAAEVSQPQLANVVVGFYDFVNDVVVPPILNDQPAEIFVPYQVKIAPLSQEAVPEPAVVTEWQFEQGISLAGYEWEGDTAAEPLTVTLWWETSSDFATIQDDYMVFVHLVDLAGNVIAQSDTRPRQGRYPTTFWGASETIVDQHTLSIPAEAAAGETILRIGMFRPVDGGRLLRQVEADFPDRVELAGPTLEDNGR